ncbi:unnamed protein product [Miscanthus lutarioriparius]|uniref:FAD-binding PCMH-type domain-containing protein n=1 Tax=Miscanthus lutarioriparius TaxID=422564 RepID=A0A811PDG8_9POAL|nr:unnamed protein product [Miscanthus lutarioriparius]
MEGAGGDPDSVAAGSEVALTGIIVAGGGDGGVASTPAGAGLVAALISNVLELDVVTGTGEVVTCSKHKDADLFDAVLGGLGQFGIITRARIPLAPAPARARWVRLLYTGAADLTTDQERLIDERGGGALAGLMDYVEGSVLTDFQGLIGSWRSQPPSSFYSAADAKRIAALAKDAGGVLYCLEGALYYGGAGDRTAADVDKQAIARPASALCQRRIDLFAPTTATAGCGGAGARAAVRAGVRVRAGRVVRAVPGPRERRRGQAPRRGPLGRAAPVAQPLPPALPHPRLRRGRLPRRAAPPRRRRRRRPRARLPHEQGQWDGATSAVLPDDEDGVFYTVGILRSAVADGDLRRMEEQNAEVARFCEAAGIPCTQYLPYYATQAEWAARHFGPRRWDTFLRRKRKYDPMAILSRGQRIFSYPLA